MGDLLDLTGVLAARGRGRAGLLRGTPATDWYERGHALEAMDPSGAADAYQRALAGRPDLADAQNNLGRILHERGTDPWPRSRCARRGRRPSQQYVDESRGECSQE